MFYLNVYTQNLTLVPVRYSMAAFSKWVQYVREILVGVIINDTFRIHKSNKVSLLGLSKKFISLTSCNTLLLLN